jgi:hypothetical protein
VSKAAPTAEQLRRLAAKQRRLAETDRNEKRAEGHRDKAKIFEREADAMERVCPDLPIRKRIRSKHGVVGYITRRPGNEVSAGNI